MICFRIMAILAWSCCAIAVHAQVYNIGNYKAVADGRTINTLAIQHAVDDCAAHGGGTVLVPAGTYLTGMITLKSHVVFHLEAGATLQGVADGSKYLSVLLIDKAEDVAVTGNGTIFGNGKHFIIKDESPDRPYLLFARNSKHIRISGITLKQGAAWTLRLAGNEGVIIDGVTIYSHANFNNDGIDIDSKDVIISNCHIDTSDDGICLKSDGPQVCENISITNCVIASNCNFIKMGTGSAAGFKNIAISNCVLRKASESPNHHWNARPENFITDSISGISGIALEVVDGGHMDQVSISNIMMTGVQTPIFMRLGSRKNPTGSLKNVIISNIIATSCSRMSSTISAVSGFYIENVMLRDVLIKGEGGAPASNSPVPENPGAYPENRMFGWSLPAYGLYVRHVRNLTLNNVQFQLAQADKRPAIWLEDVHQFRGEQVQIDSSSMADHGLKQVGSSAISCTPINLKP